MGLFNILKKEKLTEPVFIKEDNSAEEQLLKLNQLLSDTDIDKSIRGNIEQDIINIKSGINGENNIAYELKTSFMPIYIYHDLYFKYRDLTEQIDFLILHKNFILIIESKKLSGDIEINSKGEFIRAYKNEYGKIYKKDGMYSPVVQNERHREIFKKIMMEILPKVKEDVWDNGIKTVVVLSNPKTVINNKYAKKEIKNQIIKYDLLKDYMKILEKENQDKFIISDTSLSIIKEKLLELNTVNQINYYKKYEECKANSSSNGISSNIEQTEIYKELRQYRYEKSICEKIKPYFIFNNTQLEQIIIEKPQTVAQLMQISGFAEKKCQKYGSDIINIIKKYATNVSK